MTNTNAQTANAADYQEWLTELKSIMVKEYDFTQALADSYGASENWCEYYDDEFTPREALVEDTAYWDAE